jgi:hypothetical protein
MHNWKQLLEKDQVICSSPAVLFISILLQWVWIVKVPNNTLRKATKLGKYVLSEHKKIKIAFYLLFYLSVSLLHLLKPLGFLLMKQLRIQQRYGRVFPGWKEGRIYFPPTYKYSFNSDRYTGEGVHPKEKRRTPAWYGNI